MSTKKIIGAVTLFLAAILVFGFCDVKLCLSTVQEGGPSVLRQAVRAFTAAAVLVAMVYPWLFAVGGKAKQAKR